MKRSEVYETLFEISGKYQKIQASYGPNLYRSEDKTLKLTEEEKVQLVRCLQEAHMLMRMMEKEREWKD